jgi:hypothetical protein
MQTIINLSEKDKERGKRGGGEEQRGAVYSKQQQKVKMLAAGAT